MTKTAEDLVRQFRFNNRSSRMSDDEILQTIVQLKPELRPLVYQPQPLPGKINNDAGKVVNSLIHNHSLNPGLFEGIFRTWGEGKITQRAEYQVDQALSRVSIKRHEHDALVAAIDYALAPERQAMKMELERYAYYNSLAIQQRATELGMTVQIYLYLNEQWGLCQIELYKHYLYNQFALQYQIAESEISLHFHQQRITLEAKMREIETELNLYYIAEANNLELKKKKREKEIEVQAFTNQNIATMQAAERMHSFRYDKLQSLSSKIVDVQMMIEETKENVQKLSPAKQKIRIDQLTRDASILEAEFNGRIQQETVSSGNRRKA